MAMLNTIITTYFPLMRKYAISSAPNYVEPKSTVYIEPAKKKPQKNQPMQQLQLPLITSLRFRR